LFRIDAMHDKRTILDNDMPKICWLI